jgi:hypothetical protein
MTLSVDVIHDLRRVPGTAAGSDAKKQYDEFAVQQLWGEIVRLKTRGCPT